MGEDQHATFDTRGEFVSNQTVTTIAPPRIRPTVANENEVGVAPRAHSVSARVSQVRAKSAPAQGGGSPTVQKEKRKDLERRPVDGPSVEVGPAPAERKSPNARVLGGRPK